MPRGRDLRRSELVVVEGFTDEHYVSAVRDHLRSRHIRKVVNAKGGPKIVPWLCGVRLDAYTRIWIVLDAETHPHTVVGQVLKWISTQPSPDRFCTVINAPSIEAWLLAHYESPTGSRAEMERRLRDITGYEKPRLPPGLPLQDWPQAARQLARLQLEARSSPDRSACALSRPGSAMAALLPHLTGEDGDE